MPRKRQQLELYTKDCWRHVAFLLPDSVRRRPESLLCTACRHRGSSLLQQALLIVQLWVWGLGLVAFEVQLLPGLRKRFDLFLVHWGIAIEIDGPQHFHGSCYGTPAHAQWEWDRHVDAECRRAGQRLVRLHYADQQEWAGAVQKALGSQEVIIYTSSYGL